MEDSHSSSILTLTPNSAKKRRKPKKKMSPRGGPEGDSIFHKSTAPGKNAPTTPGKGKQAKKNPPGSSPDENKTPMKSNKRGKKRKSPKHDLSDSEIDIDEFLAENGDKSARKSRASLQSEVSLSTTQATDTPRSSVSKIGKKKQKTDESWEKAVEKARGLPDGAMESDDDSDDEEGPSNSSKGKSTSEKGKGGALNAIHNAAKKLKKITGKGDSPKKGQKRKIEEGSADDSLSKKVKVVEMSKKDRKKERRKSSDKKGVYDVALEAKSLWNELRRFDSTPEKRHETSGKLYELVKGKAKELIFAHDTSRVIQCLLKYGAQEHKNAIFEELREHVVEMTKSKYAKFFVRKLLKYGTKGQRNYVFRKLYGNVRKLIRHKEAAEIIEVAYNDYANVTQRTALTEEFYGPSFALFKTQELRTIGDIMNSNPEKRETILSNMKDSLSVLVDKSILQYSIVHKVFMDYFTYATDKLRADMIEVVREGVVNMLHTRDGARVAMMSLWHGTAKDRKLILKSFKTFIVKICKEEYGHLVLLSAFDSVDDTKLVQKIVLDEMLKKVTEVATDQYGRKVLLYLLAPRDSVHFHPDIVKILQQGDGNIHSKKATDVRRKELLDYISKPMIQYIVQNSKDIVTNSAALLLTLTIITHATSDLTEAMRAVAQIACEPFAQGSLDNMHIVEHPAGHLTIKRLILNDVERIKAGETVLFSGILLDLLPNGSLKSWAACNRGCFILISLVELKHSEISEKVRQEIMTIKKSLKNMTFKGAQILLDKLKE